MYGEVWFGIIGFGSVNLTEISVSVISVFTCFGPTLLPTMYAITEFQF